MSALLLTVDELRALHRILGTWLPRFVVEDHDESLRVDAAALRGLAARGLLTLAPDWTVVDGLTLDDAVTGHLEPYRTARLVVEAEAETAGVTTRFAVSAAPDGTVGLLTALPGGLVSTELIDSPALDVVARMCRLDQVAAAGGPAGPELACRVDVDAHFEADGLALAGDLDGAVAALVCGGAPEPAARAWISALVSRRGAAAISVAHVAGTTPTVPEGPIADGELRWLVADDGTAWRVTVNESSQPRSDRLVSVLTPTSVDELGRTMAGLFTPARAGGGASCQTS